MSARQQLCEPRTRAISYRAWCVARSCASCACLCLSEGCGYASKNACELACISTGNRQSHPCRGGDCKYKVTVRCGDSLHLREGISEIRKMLDNVVRENHVEEPRWKRSPIDGALHKGKPHCRANCRMGVDISRNNVTERLKLQSLVSCPTSKFENAKWAIHSWQHRTQGVKNDRHFPLALVCFSMSECANYRHVSPKMVKHRMVRGRHCEAIDVCCRATPCVLSRHKQ